jgi:hypothetical protein
MTGSMEPDERLPVELGRVTNGEYAPALASDVARETERRARELVDRQARRRGVTRREFLRTSMATAAVLLVLDACSTAAQRSRGRSPGGRFRVPEEATVEPDAAREVLGGDEFVFDVQTHFLEYDLTRPTGNFGRGFPQAACGEPDPRACFDIDHYLDALFVHSDTNLAVVSAIPASDNDGPLSTARMAEARAVATRLCGDERLLLHGQALPALGSLGAQLDAMHALVRDYPIAAWKVYTHSPARWFLDDHDPALPAVGGPFLERVRETGVEIVCVHKGFGGAYASPVDLGPAARDHPDLTFVAYHSGFESGVREGPYDPNGLGVDRLVRTVREHSGPGRNVYAELGSTWFNAMRSPDAAAHVLGKLLSAVGPDNVLWGTDSIWYGSPQAQIEAFRVFEITEEYQERFGYPALTPEVKRKILGANAAALYGVEPNRTRCEFTRDELADARRALAPLPVPGARITAAMRAHMRAHGVPGA